MEAPSSDRPGKETRIHNLVERQAALDAKHQVLLRQLKKLDDRQAELALRESELRDPSLRRRNLLPRTRRNIASHRLDEDASNDIGYILNGEGKITPKKTARLVKALKDSGFDRTIHPHDLISLKFAPSAEEESGEGEDEEQDHTLFLYFYDKDGELLYVIVREPEEGDVWKFPVEMKRREGTPAAIIKYYGL